MNRYEKKHLKEAIVGYISGVYTRFLSVFKLHVISSFFKKRVEEAMLLYTQSVEDMSEERKAVFSLMAHLGKYKLQDDLFPLNPVCLITIEERLRKVFEQFNINLDFLSDYNIGIMDFVYLVIELADNIKVRQKKEKEAGIETDEKDMLEQEVKRLILTRYTQIDVSVVPVIVETLGSISVIFEISVNFRRILQLNVVDTKDGTLDKITFQEKGGVRCMIVEGMDKGSLVGNAYELEGIKHDQSKTLVRPKH